MYFTHFLAIPTADDFIIFAVRMNETIIIFLIKSFGRNPKMFLIDTISDGIIGFLFKSSVFHYSLQIYFQLVSEIFLKSVVSLQQNVVECS